MESFDELVAIAHKLRKECPWDKIQTIDTLKKSFAGEAQEIVEAIEKKDYDNLGEEIGDVMMNLLMISVIAEEGGHFDLEKSLKRICKKMIHRHPHVYGDAVAHTPEDATRLFNEAKAREKEEGLK